MLKVFGKQKPEEFSVFNQPIAINICFLYNTPMMQKSPEQSLGKEIFLAQAHGVPKRYREDPVYRDVRLERYSRQLEIFQIPLRPSSLTAHTLGEDWGLRRLRYTTFSNSLPVKDNIYLGDAIIDINSIMTTLIMLTTLDGVANPWAKLYELERQGRLSTESADRFMEFIGPIKSDLQQGGDDSRLIGLLQQAGLRFRSTENTNSTTLEREGIIYQAYRDLYPTAAKFLDERRPNARPIARPSNWF